MELGIQVPFSAADGAGQARRVEDEGFDIGLFGDSQLMVGDPYVRMAIAAQSTTRLRLCTAVTNPATRDSSVTANAALTVNHESGGRAILGIGRGDSALAKIGRSYPAPLKRFETYVRELRGYLDGESVDRDGVSGAVEWLPSTLPPVPIDVACTGARTIGLAAALADRVTFSVGATEDRVKWAMDQATAAASHCKRATESLAFGAYVIIAVSDDIDGAIAAVRGKVAGFAHFSGMPDSNLDALGDHELRATSARLQDSYDHREHMRADATHAGAINPDFVRSFAVIGPPGLVIERLSALRDLGLGHLYCSLVHRGADPEFIQASRRRFVDEVIPGLRTSG